MQAYGTPEGTFSFLNTRTEIEARKLQKWQSKRQISHLHDLLYRLNDTISRLSEMKSKRQISRFNDL